MYSVVVVVVANVLLPRSLDFICMMRKGTDCTLYEKGTRRSRFRDEGRERIGLAFIFIAGTTVLSVVELASPMNFSEGDEPCL